MNSLRSLLTAAGALAALTAATAHAELVGSYIGIDGRNPLASGTYRGLPNPNFGRLTFLYAHVYEYVPGLAPAGATAFNVNHYHPIGAYSLSGPTNAPVINPTSGNNRIPEPGSRQPGLTLVPTTNAPYAGKLVNARSDEHYSDLRWRSTHDLNQPAIYGPGSPEWVLFHSSAGTQTNSLEGATVALELLGKTEGLHVGTTNQLDVLTHPGDRFVIGAGDRINFQPVFWTEGNAAVGTYSATFKLVDINTDGGRTPFPESGAFSLDFRVVPPPALDIGRSVTLTLPLVLQGRTLETAVSPEGPWTPVDTRGAQHSGTNQLVTVPAAGPAQLFRLRQP
jgi:hypothetical protein